MMKPSIRFANTQGVCHSKHKANWGACTNELFYKHILESCRTLLLKCFITVAECWVTKMNPLFCTNPLSNMCGQFWPSKSWIWRKCSLSSSIFDGDLGHSVACYRRSWLGWEYATTRNFQQAWLAWTPCIHYANLHLKVKFHCVLDIKTVKQIS